MFGRNLINTSSLRFSSFPLATRTRFTTPIPTYQTPRRAFSSSKFESRGSDGFKQSNFRTFASNKMSSKQVITAQDAPKAIGPYSHAIKANGFIFVSGQIGLDPKSGNLVSDTIEGQTKQVLTNIGTILKAAGSSYEKIVKTTILLKDINDFPKVNEIYASFFKGDYPARATYAVAALPKNGLIEIEVVAIE